MIVFFSGFTALTALSEPLASTTFCATSSSLRVVTNALTSWPSIPKFLTSSRADEDTTERFCCSSQVPELISV